MRSLPQAVGELRWRCASLECSLYGGHQERPQRPPLLAARCYHRQEPLGKPAAVFAVRAETALPPQHRGPQRPLCSIVGRLRPFHPREGPQGRPPPPQLAAQSRGLVVRVLLPTPEQPPQSRLERDQPALQLLTPAFPRAEAVPQGEQSRDFRQAPAANGLR